MTFRLAGSALAAALACLASAPASASPTVGVAFGKTETKTDAAAGADANTTAGLFVRGHLTRAIALQGELSKLETDATSSTSLRALSLSAIADLGHGSLVPIALLGVGFDIMSHDGSTQSDGHYAHLEAGVGLEYRFRNGFVLGADVRLGTRSALDPQTQPIQYPVGLQNGTALWVAGSNLPEGEYRSARLTAGVRF